MRKYLIISSPSECTEVRADSVSIEPQGIYFYGSDNLVGFAPASKIVIRISDAVVEVPKIPSAIESENKMMSLAKTGGIDAAKSDFYTAWRLCYDWIRNSQK